MTWTGEYIGYAVTGVTLLVIWAFRLRRMRKANPLKLERLWIVPTLYTAFAVALFWNMPPHGLQWLWAAAALVAGGGVGWLRGSTMRITVDPVAHDLNQQQSPAALLLIAALVAARWGLRAEIGDMSHASNGVIDALVAFAVGLLAMQRVEMYLRARRLLDQARLAGQPT